MDTDSIKSMKLMDLIKELHSSKLAIPELQREYVWKSRQVINLLDSLYRNLPIGNLVLWETGPNEDNVIIRDISDTHRNGKTHRFLLDGQQRLMSLYNVYHGIKSIQFRLYDESFHIDNARTRGAGFVDVRKVFQMETTANTVFENLRNEEALESLTSDIIKDRIKRLKEILAAKVPVLIYRVDDIGDAMRLFLRLNCGGTKLKSTDIALAEIAVECPTLVQNKVRAFLSKCLKKDFSLDVQTVIRAFVACHTHKMTFKQDEAIWKDTTPRELKEQWDETERAMRDVLDFLEDTLLWDSSDWITSSNALIPIIYWYKHTIKGKRRISESERALLFKWLHLVSVRQAFRGAGWAELDKLLAALKNNKYDITVLWKQIKPEIRKEINQKDIENVQQRKSAMLSLYYSMLRRTAAKDWETAESIKGHAFGDNKTLEIHHIFPQSKLNENRWDSKDINHFANYALLTKRTNISIKDTLPCDYLKHFAETPNGKRRLKAQCIPLDEKLWEIDNYKGFLKERSRLLCESMNKLLGFRNGRPTRG